MSLFTASVGVCDGGRVSLQMWARLMVGVSYCTCGRVRLWAWPIVACHCSSHIPVIHLAGVCVWMVRSIFNDVSVLMREVGESTSRH